MAWQSFLSLTEFLKRRLLHRRRKGQKRYSTPGTRWDGMSPITPHAADQPYGQEWALICDEMLATDPKLSAAAMQLCNNLLDASWTIETGARGDAEAKRNAEFIREALGLDGRPCHLSSGSFEHELRPIVRYPLVGYHVSEEVYRCDSDGLFWLDSFADIATPSIWEWVRNRKGSLEKIIQLCPSVGIREPLPIPASKALVVTRNKTGDDYLGVGLLSPCWGWWKVKKSLLRSLELGVQRLASPILMLRPDRQSLQDEGYSLDEQQEMLNKARDFGEAWTEGDASVLIAPAGIDPSVFAGDAFDATRVIDAVRHANEEIAAAFLSNFSEMGLNEVGARSVGEIHWNSYRSSLANYLDEIADAINGPSRPGGGTIAKLLEMNFYGADKCPPDVLPRIAHRGVEVNGVRDMANILPQLVAAGLITPTDDLEAAILRELKVGSPAVLRGWEQRLAETGSVQLPDSQGGRPPLEEIR